MLHIHRGPDVDPGRQQFLDVLPALGMARAGHIGMRQFVHQHQGGLARKRSIEVELAQFPSLVGHDLRRQ